MNRNVLFVKLFLNEKMKLKYWFRVKVINSLNLEEDFREVAIRILPPTINLQSTFQSRNLKRYYLYLIFGRLDISLQVPERKFNDAKKYFQLRFQTTA